MCPYAGSPEAEPLSRRHLQIFAGFGRRTGHEHPHFRAALSNYIDLLNARMLRKCVQSRKTGPGALVALTLKVFFEPLEGLLGRVKLPASVEM